MSASSSRVSLLAACVISASCYRYTSAPVSAPTAGSAVRLQLTGPGTASLSPILGRNAVAVDGTIVSADDSSFAVSVSATHQRGEDALTWAGERVVIPRSAVESVESRSLDRKRTLAVVGLILLGAIAAKVVISGIDALAGGDDGGTAVTPP